MLLGNGLLQNESLKKYLHLFLFFHNFSSAYPCTQLFPRKLPCPPPSTQLPTQFKVLLRTQKRREEVPILRGRREEEVFLPAKLQFSLSPPHSSTLPSSLVLRENFCPLIICLFEAQKKEEEEASGPKKKREGREISKSNLAEIVAISTRVGALHGKKRTYSTFWTKKKFLLNGAVGNIFYWLSCSCLVEQFAIRKPS